MQLPPWNLPVISVSATGNSQLTAAIIPEVAIALVTGMIGGALVFGVPASQWGGYLPQVINRSGGTIYLYPHAKDQFEGYLIGQAIPIANNIAVTLLVAPSGIILVTGTSAAGWETITDLGSVQGELIIPFNVGTVFKATLIGNVTSMTITVPAGLPTNLWGKTAIRLTQGGAGSYDAAFPSNFNWQGGFTPSLSTAVGASDTVQLLTWDQFTTWDAAIAMQVVPA